MQSTEKCVQNGLTDISYALIVT